ncbi:MAG: hypothetical protein UHY90_06855 [Treponema sp.]|nr:hypothetical protein [Treponema sp.]
MTAKEILKFIETQIHTVIIASVDQDNFPVTCAIDIMDSDESSLYFLTACGKGFYKRLISNSHISLTGIKGKYTMSRVAVSIQGIVEENGTERLPLLLQKNPYMNEIYPTKESQKALTVFKLTKGYGEWFDLSKKPIERISFSLGKSSEEKKYAAYTINEKCTNCKKCQNVCPQSCIDFSGIHAKIIK